MEQQYCGTERRQFGRRDVIIHAWAFTSGRARLPCIMYNCSPAGALLEFPNGAPIADAFWLGFDSDRRELRCRVRHRDKVALGVSFDRQANIEERDIAAKVGRERACTRSVERYSYIGRKIHGNANKG